MVRLLIRLAILLVSAALGLLAASALVDGVEVTATGFVVVVGVFTVAQAVLSPFIAKTAARYAPAFLGGIGLVSTFVALLLASLLGDGLRITGGAVPWILAALVVWLVTALATFLLPMFFLKEKLGDRRGDGDGPAARSARG